MLFMFILLIENNSGSGAGPDGLKKDQGPEKFLSVFIVKVIVILQLGWARRRL